MPRKIEMTEEELKDAIELANSLTFIPIGIRKYVEGIVDGAVLLEDLRRQDQQQQPQPDKTA